MSTHESAGAGASLPEITDERIDEIEAALFADIARERDRTRARSARRGSSIVSETTLIGQPRASADRACSRARRSAS